MSGQVDEAMVRFTGGLLKLAAAVRQPLHDADFEAYDVLRGLVTVGEWDGYVTWCLATGEWPDHWPKLEELRESLLRWQRERRPKLAGTVGECEACRGTGFEFEERDGQTWVAPCQCRRKESA